MSKVLTEDKELLALVTATLAGRFIHGEESYATLYLDSNKIHDLVKIAKDIISQVKQS